MPLKIKLYINVAFRAKSGNYSGSSDGYGDGYPVGGGISNGIDSGGPGKQYPEQLTAKYIVGRLLGTGSCGSVYLGKENWEVIVKNLCVEYRGF